MVAANEQPISVTTWLHYPKEPMFNLVAILSKHDVCYNHKKAKQNLTHNAQFLLRLLEENVEENMVYTVMLSQTKK